MRCALLLLLFCACGPHGSFTDDAGTEAGKDAAQESGCTNPAPYWPDADDDGYGDALAAPTMACAPRSGFVGNKLDCGDGDPQMHPGQTMAQRGPAKGKTAGPAADYDCNGAETIVNAMAVQIETCMLVNMKCNDATADGWTSTSKVNSCATQYDWHYCDPNCFNLLEKRYPDCL